MNEFAQFLADCWRMFTEVQVPVLNISFASLYLGVFVVGVSIVILRPLLGIGFGSANNIFTGVARAGKRGYDNAYRKRQRQNEYDTHRADRIEDSANRSHGNVHIRYKKGD